jgi:8-oxo-dGTP pyrophosphatase MutT (NUDIX family)
MHLENIQTLVTERDLLASGLPARQSSRIILLDADDRVWLFRINDPVRPRWILPGGGVEEGESWETTARRELWEECGVNDAQFGPIVAKREAIGTIANRPTLAQERYFVARLHEQSPHINNMLPEELTDYTSQQWFSAADIRASYEQVYPIGLADMLDLLQRGEYPAEPWTWPD